MMSSAKLKRKKAKKAMTEKKRVMKAKRKKKKRQTKRTNRKLHVPFFFSTFTMRHRHQRYENKNKLVK
jgi:hypothetical protein